MAKSKGSISFTKNFVFTFFSGFGVKWNFVLIDLHLHKSDIWKNFVVWVMGQNGLRQSIAGLLNQLYCTKMLMNVLDFLDVDIDSRVMKDRLWVFKQARLMMLSANQIWGFLAQLYFDSDLVSLWFFLC